MNMFLRLTTCCLSLISMLVFVPVQVRAQPTTMRVLVQGSVVAIPLPNLSTSAVVLSPGHPPQQVNPRGNPETLSQGKLLILRTGDRAVQDNTDASRDRVRYRLPIYVHYVAPSNQLQIAQLTAEVAGGGIQLTDDKSKFTGHIFFAFVDNTTQSNTLGPIEVFVSAPVEVTPQIVSVSRTNHWDNVALRITTPPGNELEARVRTPSENAVILPIKVIPPVLQLIVSPDSEILGLGLQTATVTVSSCIPQRLGEIKLRTTRGKLSKEIFKIGIDNAVKFTSIGLRESSITATSPLLSEEVSKTITFVFPYSFFLAAILGGGLGGLIRAYAMKSDSEENKETEKKKETKSKSTPKEDVFWGVVVGLAMSVMCLLGFNVPSLIFGKILDFEPIHSEMFVGVVALFSGINGVKILTTIADSLPERLKKIFGGGQ